MYGIHVDQFLAVQHNADEEITSRLGAPPGVGEMVSDEWFRQRDTRLLEIWNDLDPDGVRTYCDPVAE